jgi:hypothetical protein
MTEPTTPSDFRTVALPSEHGGWSLTLEPVLLGLLVEPSWSGGLLGVGALVAFLARSPLKVALVDGWRGRTLPRTRLAFRLLAGYLLVLIALGVAVTATAEGPVWVPLACAAPLIGFQAGYDLRSRGRRLLPELLGPVGIGAVAPAIVLAGGGDGRVAAGLWVVVAARAIAAVLHVRVQLRRAKAQPTRLWHNDAAQAVALAAVIAGAAGDIVTAATVTAIAGSGAVHSVLARLRPPATPVLGVQQIAIGLLVVIVTAASTS